ncbi:uncharacterized protein DS421_12g383940 [Arachis hypogaea]|nr:uncharacterized protein DS421_12g383940 [Arachis hypogaea]
MSSDSSSAPTPSPSRSFSRSAGMRSSSHSATPPFCLLQCCASILPSCPHHFSWGSMRVGGVRSVVAGWEGGEQRVVNR